MANQLNMSTITDEQIEELLESLQQERARRGQVDPPEQVGGHWVVVNCTRKSNPLDVLDRAKQFGPIGNWALLGELLCIAYPEWRAADHFRQYHQQSKLKARIVSSAPLVTGEWFKVSYLDLESVWPKLGCPEDLVFLPALKTLFFRYSEAFTRINLAALSRKLDITQAEFEKYTPVPAIGMIAHK